MFWYKVKKKVLIERDACEVCGYLTLNANQRGLCDICPVCFWEDDGLHDDLDEPCEGPNGELSVREARANFAKFGASSEEMVAHVRKPLPEETPKA